MISLGILTLHPHLFSDYATQIGKQSKTYQIHVYRFHPFDWDPKTNRVKGYVFDHVLDDWKPDIFTLPAFIYDRCYYSNSRHAREFSVVQQLKRRAHFLSTGLPNKWKVYEQLSRDPIIASFLPKTIKVATFEDIIQQLLERKKIVLKPIFGTHGKGMFFIELTRSSQLLIQTHRNGKKMIKTFSMDKFRAWYRTQQLENRYILQPFLHLTNKNNQPFDIRILVQKNDVGKWQEIGRGIRVGKRGNFVSNLHNGGKVQSFSRHLKQNRKVNLQLDTLVNVLPSILDKHFHPLFELGIDIGIEPTGKCWLLEVNSKPGYRTILSAVNIEKLSEHPLRYCLYLRKELFKHEIDRATNYPEKIPTFNEQTSPSENLHSSIETSKYVP